MFPDLMERLSDHMFIFTDGSKLNNFVAFSITTENSVLRIAKLDEYSSNFSAEIIAIYEACVLVRGLSSRFAICTDSLSALRSVLNVSNTGFYPTSIRTIWIEKFPNLQLIWVPSHCGITGNELADHSAKNAIIQVLFYTDNLNWIDLARQIDGQILLV